MVWNFPFSTSYFTFVLLSENKKKVVPIFIGFILLFLHVFSPKSFIYEKTDRSYEYQINYGNYLVQADIIKTLSISSDSVFLDGWDEIIYIQSDRIPKYKYGWYTSMMPHFLKYSEERIKMFKLSPPEIYYGNCYFGGKLPKFVIDDYVPFYFSNKQTCLHIKRSKLLMIKDDQWNKIKQYNFYLKSK